jgi:hypothetical protein
MLHDKITEIFFVTDNFCNEFKNEYSKLSTPKLQGNKDTRNRAASMCDSEIITLLIAFHSGFYIIKLIDNLNTGYNVSFVKE